MEKKNSPWGLAFAGLLFLAGFVLFALSLSIQHNHTIEKPPTTSASTER